MYIFTALVLRLNIINVSNFTSNFVKINIKIKKTQSCEKKTQHSLAIHIVCYATFSLTLSQSYFITFVFANLEINPYMYIKSKTNYPPHIIKQLPIIINKRSTNLYCNKDEFDKATPLFSNALKNSGYGNELEFN